MGPDLNFNIFEQNLTRGGVVIKSALVKMKLFSQLFSQEIISRSFFGHVQ